MLRDRRSGLLVALIDTLREAVRGVRPRSPFRIIVTDLGMLQDQSGPTRQRM